MKMNIQIAYLSLVIGFVIAFFRVSQEQKIQITLILLIMIG